MDDQNNFSTESYVSDNFNEFEDVQDEFKDYEKLEPSQSSEAVRPSVNKKDHRRVLELFLGGIFVVLLILITLMFIGLADGKSVQESQSNLIISDSYNTNNYNTYVAPRSAVTTYTKVSRVVSDSDYYENPLRYSSWANHKVVKGVFGNNIDRYYIYVKNTDYEPGYYTVRFYFEDYYGNEDMEIFTSYIKSGETKTFFYQSIYSDDYDFYKWHYAVTPETSIKK